MSNDRVQRRTARELGGLFRNERGDGEGQVIAYEDEAGSVRSVPGDAESAFLKTPPFVTDPAPWVRNELLSVTEYVPTQTVEIYQRRLIQVYFELTIVDAGEVPGGQLSIIPEGRADGEFYVASLVGSAVTTIDPVGARFGPGFGSRTFQPMELRTAQMDAGIIRFLLAFDVSPYEAFRLNLLDLYAPAAGANSVSLRYALSD